MEGKQRTSISWDLVFMIRATMRPFDRVSKGPMTFKLPPHTVKTQHFSEDEDKNLSDTKTQLKISSNRTEFLTKHTMPTKSLGC
jgi:hypothetical protein